MMTLLASFEMFWPVFVPEFSTQAMGILLLVID